MGEHEKCPKCGRKVRFEKGGYDKANVSAGYGFQLPDSISCINCGYYKEVFEQKQPINPKFKKGGATNDYPHTRKSLGEPGWLKDIICDHWDFIVELRLGGDTWREIHTKLNKVEPLFKEALKTSITNSFMRMVKNKDKVPPAGGKRERV